mmetsp:Transcript_11775/g.25846  ORF Transcript_11775/g.25846 Transcript_11775/m.25846 type:complete len:576 (+) Transcript_11775:293-2020(+)|eukprot:CAMPEP_0172332282 /NCGR_PEP_ID=MMETSP1058-20130122/62355_1 /TAXON_ID=83371 /ORGANISM="Detonula confervacea, Strain CCMP 353" /LENGTH=575 /DNA_ID=CAMNT_0013049561 /DNA_START=219 /DNA_END=1946 /DNA_ORIENTATION=+
MPHHASPKRGKAAASGSPSKIVGTKSPKNGVGGTPTKQKSKKKQTKKNRVDPLFAFDTAKEEYNWGRPKRRIKTISRFDPTIKEKQSGCKIGHGFICPQCSATCTYDSRACYQCHLECCYEAGVGVVVLQDRRISYKPASPAKKKAKGEKRARAVRGKAPVKCAKEKSSSGATNDDDGNPSKNNNISSSSLNGDDGNLDNNHDIQSPFFKDGGKSGRKKNIFANLKEKLKVATDSNSKSQQGTNDDNMASRMEEATQEWTRSTIAASKYGAYSTTSSNPPNSEEDPLSSEVSAENIEPPSLEDDIKCCQDLKQELLSIQLKYDSMCPGAIKAEEEFRDNISKLEAAILQRNKDSAAFSKTIASSSARIGDIKKRVMSLTIERDEFVKKVEGKGLSSVPKIIPNYSTRIDALQTKMLQMRSECDAAKERVKDLMSGTEVWKQEREKAAKDLEEMETKHGETFTQCYREIESFKQQLSEATSKISATATEKAQLVEKVSSTLIYVSKVRSAAETQTKQITELESSIASLTVQRDESKVEITRIEAEKEEAVAKTKSLEDVVKELRGQIESLKSHDKK